MPRRRRSLRILKWAGFALCLLIAAAWWASYHYNVCYSPPGGAWVLWFRNGITELYYAGAAPWHDTGWRAWPLRTADFDLSEPFRLELPRIKTGLFGGWTALVIPYWLLLSLAAAGTGLLFWLARRFPRGRCQTCGYDLTGNVSGLCPECGQRKRE